MAAGSELARRIDGAARALVCGRDLVQTHLTHGPGGGLVFRSEWGSVLTTPAARWALLAEMGSLVHRLVPVGEQLGLSARARGSPRARQALSDACHWLQIMDTSIRPACQDEPRPATDRELLRAVPAGGFPPPQRPEFSGPASGLPQAVSVIAERARHAAWLSGSKPPWGPGMSVNALRQSAGASTLTSYHCQTLLRSLARGQRLAGNPGSHCGRQRRLPAGPHPVARPHPCPGPGHHHQPAAITRRREAGDLALWTGRLAHADPGWTPASRPPRSATPGEADSWQPGEMAEVLAAVLDACDAMTRIAATDRRQVHALAGAGRLLAAAGPVPATLDMLGPVTPARADRIGALLTLYQYTAQASAEATATVSVAATAARVPHHSWLPAIRTAQCRDPEADEAAGQLAEAQAVYEPGKIEQTLRGLGITSTGLLRRAEDLDRAAEQLITQAAAEHGAEPRDSSAEGTRAQAGRGVDRYARDAARHTKLRLSRNRFGTPVMAGSPPVCCCVRPVIPMSERRLPTGYGHSWHCDHIVTLTWSYRRRSPASNVVTYVYEITSAIRTGIGTRPPKPHIRNL